MTIKVGDRLPNVSVRLVTPHKPKPVETKDYFAGQKIVMFGLRRLHPDLPQEPPARLHRQRGRVQGQGRRRNRHDRGQRPLRAPGLVGRDRLQGPYRFSSRRRRRLRQGPWPRVDASAGGLGVRSKRYAMLVEDGVVEQVTFEPKPGEADVSSATHLLEQLK